MDALAEGRVRIDHLRALHLETLDALALPASCGYEVRALLRELESLLDGVSMVRELTPRTKDLLVSYGERMSSRILAAQLVEATAAGRHRQRRRQPRRGVEAGVRQPAADHRLAG